ncbi:hypothetical protein HanLR1_Chr12g0435251 [Helianthus annuus]|nr:hypothetical protein HanLR1_Chr12g0435251 [Helianthus annuus]
MIARCYHEWLNLLAEASRKGLGGEEELQWDSYEIINEQLGKEFREGMESRKEKRASGPGVRAPKTLEQRKKISEAIAAKWADPVRFLLHRIRPVNEPNKHEERRVCSFNFNRTRTLRKWVCSCSFTFDVCSFRTKRTVHECKM